MTVVTDLDQYLQQRHDGCTYSYTVPLVTDDTHIQCLIHFPTDLSCHRRLKRIALLPVN